MNNLIYLSEIEPEFDIFSAPDYSVGQSSFHFQTWFLTIYLLGVGIMIFKLIRFLKGIFKLRKNALSYSVGRVQVVKTNTLTPFSFFNTIFLPIDETNKMIIRHELAHIRQVHWLDLVIAEGVSLLLWFNPFVVLYKNSLKLQHEYLADSSVITGQHAVENYLYCMLQRVQWMSTGSGLVSPFFCKTIKNRVIMMTKNKTSLKFSWLYLLILPLIGILLAAFTLKSHPFNDGKRELTANNSNVPSISPIATDKVTKVSGYGDRIHPMTGKKDFHYGIDMAAKTGVEVYATADGKVVEARFDEETLKGNIVLIQHDAVYSTFYAHLDNFVVKAGDKVTKGQVIGYVGNTGLSTGPHLHYEVLCNNERVDPEKYFSK